MATGTTDRRPREAGRDALAETARAVRDVVARDVGARLGALEKRLGDAVGAGLAGAEASRADLARGLAASLAEVKALRRELADRDAAWEARLEDLRQTYEKALARQADTFTKALPADAAPGETADLVGAFAKSLDEKWGRRLEALRKEWEARHAEERHSADLRQAELKALLTSLPVPQVVVTDKAFHLDIPQAPAPVVHVEVPENAIRVQMEKSIVNFQAPQGPAPLVTVEAPRPRLVRKSFTYDEATGRPLSVTEEAVEEKT